MVDQLVEIPLPGRTFVATQLETPGTSVSVTLPSFVAGPENPLLATVVNRLLDAPQPVDGQSAPHQSPGHWQLCPLVLWGVSGTGKSHLAHGLVRRIKRLVGDDRADYLAATEFRQELRQAIDENRVDEFRRRIRSLTVLALDDLQCIPDTMYLQEELLRTFDEVTARGGLFIATANRPIQLLGNLWPALVSRLAGGLVLRLEPPGPAARRRLAERIAAMAGLPISAQTAARLATSFDGTANDLFGAIFELQHRRHVDNFQPLERSLDQWLEQSTHRRPALAEIIRVVARYYSVPQKVLKSASRKKSVVAARAMAIYLARELSGLGYQRIADALGGRDHTTIMHSYRRIERDVGRDLATQHAVDDLRRILLAR